jgi:hypothetical protein
MGNGGITEWTRKVDSLQKKPRVESSETGEEGGKSLVRLRVCLFKTVELRWEEAPKPDVTRRTKL